MRQKQHSEKWVRNTAAFGRSGGCFIKGSSGQDSGTVKIYYSRSESVQTRGHVQRDTHTKTDYFFFSA